MVERWFIGPKDGPIRSRYDHQPRPRDEAPLQAASERLAGAWPTYGYRWITALLHREGFHVNHTHVVRLLRERGCQRQPPARRPRTTQSDPGYLRSPNLVQDLEEVTLHDYEDFHDAYQHLRRFLGYVYQHKRIHSASGYLTPEEFETQWLQQQRIAVPVKFETP